ncbi:hypothetical protein PSEWESI4_00185 [Pseudomonas carbonaria]|uniref:Uncharacterized protein n=2 Tax=Zestomonas carbonaria TaxID=2762745 RepID=A0A7U7I7B3_9GAMM|nr:hypothetical protein PSEWESI4_00185 [Pseudomonas carbonaria]
MGWRFFATLAILGLLVGLMIGRLTESGPAHLERVEVLEDGLALWFDREVAVRGERIDGALVLHLDAGGKVERGQLRVAGKVANWRTVSEGKEALRLELVAARPLHGTWRGAAAEGRWRLEISLRSE